MIKAKYLYCIVKQKPSQKFNIYGIERKEVYAIDNNQLSVVVSDAQSKEYFPTRENLITHQKVIEEIFKSQALIPVSFGTVTEESSKAKELLTKNKKEIFKIFKKIDDKIEIGLKVFWQHMPDIFKEIVNENKEVQIAKSKKVVGRNTMLAVGEFVAHALEKKKSKEGGDILQPLLKIVQETKENDLIRDDMVLNVDFLLSKSRQKEFDNAINEIDKKYSKRLKFKYVGPAPPSNFATLHIT